MLLKEQQHQSELAELRATIGEYEHMQRTSRERGDLFNQVISCQNQGGEMLQSVREALAGSAEHLMAEKGALCELDQLFAQTRAPSPVSPIAPMPSRMRRLAASQPSISSMPAHPPSTSS